jgi:hydrogenase expression/formation protein HypE
MTATIDPMAAICPIPAIETEQIMLGHGSGGRLSEELLRRVVLPALGDAVLAGPLQDAALLEPMAGPLVISTDSFVVSPLFFPGGDIGSLAVHGSINDVAMRGAEPLALTLAFIVEEGLEQLVLSRVATSVGRAAHAAGVRVVAGDTKVVDRGSADGLFVTTTALGRVLPGAQVGAERAQPGDIVLLSGPIALHGTTVLSTREGLGFEANLASDSQPLHRVVQALVAACGDKLHVLRDPTRGGLASALNELAEASGVGIQIDEAALPVPPTVASACELLGLDPMHVANEGCLVAFVSPAAADVALAAMRAVAESAGATAIGDVVSEPPGRVVLRTLMGSRRIVDMLIGEQLPRIC